MEVNNKYRPFWVAAAILLAGIIFVALVPVFFTLSDLFSDDATIKAVQAISFVLVIFLIALYIIPKLQVSKFSDQAKKLELENKSRAVIAQSIGGLIVVFGFIFSWWQTSINETGQVTGRFATAVEQLGNDNLAIKLGGIYALERIANDSEEDYWVIMEVLTTYMKQNHPAQIRANSSVVFREHVLADVKAILAVICRRDPRDLETENGKHIDLQKVDLQRVDMGGEEINLQNARLERAALSYTHFEGANFDDADLHGAYLYGAILNRASFRKADLLVADIRTAKLRRANLGGANLQRTDLSKADLRGANLQYANLKKAILGRTNLKGADLTKAKNLRQEQIDKAIVDEHTKFPDYLRNPRLR